MEAQPSAGVPPICRVSRKAPDRQLQSRRSPQTLLRRHGLYREKRPTILLSAAIDLWIAASAKQQKYLLTRDEARRITPTSPSCQNC